MSRSPARSAALLAATVAAALLASACSRPESTPAAQAASVPHASATPAAGLGSGLTDSISDRADRGRIRGADSARVWLIEISDFQCPYCKLWHDNTYRTIDREYVRTGRIHVAYINLPLGMHAHALTASEAAMCASVQGKFWELHDALFDTQAAWEGLKDPMAKFDSIAVAAKVNPTAWRSCMASHATLPLINADRDRAARAGVRSTPSFFVGSRALVGAYPADTFRVVLDAALASAAAAH